LNCNETSIKGTPGLRDTGQAGVAAAELVLAGLYVVGRQAVRNPCAARS
jgi:hypothetical protein